MMASVEIAGLLRRAEKWLESPAADPETAELVIDLMTAIETVELLEPLAATWKQQQNKYPTPRQKLILEWLYSHPSQPLTTHVAAELFSSKPENFYPIFHTMNDCGFVTFSYGGRKGKRKTGSFVTLNPTLAALSRQDFDNFLNGTV